MLNEMREEVMNGQNDEAIKWLLSFGEIDETLKESIDTFRKYYFKCLNELKRKKLTAKELEGTEAYINEVQNYLGKEFFQKICLISNKNKDSLQLLTEEEISVFQNIPSHLNNKEKITYLSEKLNKPEQEILSIICKVIRFYNMQLKYSHTARITFVAASQVENMQITNPTAAKIIITSALMHDIGRFYQAINYNTLDDRVIKAEENEIHVNGTSISLKVDHAVAGYYYSLMDLYVLNALNKATYQDLITHSIAAIIVRYHQLPNSQLQEFQSQITSFAFNDDLESDAISFIVDAFRDAPLLENQQGKYNHDKEHRKFIEKIIDEIIATKKEEIITKYKNSSAFFEPDEEDVNNFISKIENAFEKNNELKEKVEAQLTLYYQENGDDQELLDSIVNAIKKVINHHATFEVIEDDEIESIIKKMADYDIAYSVQQKFKKHEPVKEDVKKLIALSLNLTMDADKIDILNQRAIGIYNTSYNPSSYSIYPENNLTLLELLNKHFAFQMTKTPLQIDKRILDILEENTNQEIKNWFYKQGINLEEYKKEINTFGKMIIGPTHPLYKFIAEIPWKNVVKNDGKQKEDYTSSTDKMPTLRVATSTIEKNLEGKSQEEKVAFYRHLIITPEQEEGFKIADIYPLGVSKLQKEYQGTNQEYILWNPIMGLIWQINQFIFVNLRSRGSYEFLTESHTFENIYKQYQENPVLQEIIKPYLAYAMLFVDTITNIQTDGKTLTLEEQEGYQDVLLYDNSFMTKIKQFVKERYESNPELLVQYEEQLQNALNKGEKHTF